MTTPSGALDLHPVQLVADAARRRRHVARWGRAKVYGAWPGRGRVGGGGAVLAHVQEGVAGALLEEEKGGGGEGDVEITSYSKKLLKDGKKIKL